MPFNNKIQNRFKKFININFINSKWATVQDIMKIDAVERNKARDIKNEISDEIISSGFKLSNNLVPMEKIIDYFKIHVDFLVLINNSKYGNL